MYKKYLLSIMCFLSMTAAFGSNVSFPGCIVNQWGQTVCSQEQALPSGPQVQWLPSYQSQYPPVSQQPASVSHMSCSRNPQTNVETCTTNEYEFEIHGQQYVDMIMKPESGGGTGWSDTIPFNAQGVCEVNSVFCDHVYQKGPYKIEVGHTDGTIIYLTIYGRTEQFNYEKCVGCNQD